MRCNAIRYNRDTCDHMHLFNMRAIAQAADESLSACALCTHPFFVAKHFVSYFDDHHRMGVRARHANVLFIAFTPKAYRHIEVRMYQQLISEFRNKKKNFKNASLSFSMRRTSYAVQAKCQRFEKIYMNKDRLRFHVCVVCVCVFVCALDFFVDETSETGSKIYNKFVANAFLPKKIPNKINRLGKRMKPVRQPPSELVVFRLRAQMQFWPKIVNSNSVYAEGQTY